MKKHRPVDPGPPPPPPPPPGGGKPVDPGPPPPPPGKYTTRNIFTWIIVISLFEILLALYNLSSDKFLWLSAKAWDFIWVLAENGLAILMAVIIAQLTSGVFRKFILFTLVPYFTVRLVYHVTTYTGIYFMSPKDWSALWSVICVLVFLLGLNYCRIIIKNDGRK